VQLLSYKASPFHPGSKSKAIGTTPALDNNTTKESAGTAAADVSAHKYPTWYTPCEPPWPCQWQGLGSEGLHSAAERSEKQAGSGLQALWRELRRGEVNPVALREVGNDSRGRMIKMAYVSVAVGADCKHLKVYVLSLAGVCEAAQQNPFREFEERATHCGVRAYCRQTRRRVDACCHARGALKQHEPE
jgi:hypothetical protein